MKKYEIVKSKMDFNNIIKNSPFIKNKNFVIYIRKKEESNPKFGIAISKSVGNAVERNKLKRRLRSIIDNSKNDFKKERDYIIMIKRSCKELNYQEMKIELDSLLKEII